MADNLTDEQLELLNKAINELRSSLILSDKTQAALMAALNKDADAFKENADAVKEDTSVSKQFLQDMSGFGSELVDAVSQLRENRENFTSLNPAIRAAGQLFSASGKAAGNMAESAGDAVQGLAGLSKGWKGFSAAVVGGGLLKGLGSGLKHGSEAAANMAVAFGEFATGELQNVVEAYRKVGAAGGIGAGGMNEMYDSAVKLGIGLQGFADVVSRNGPSLAYAGGSAKAGADALVGMVENSKQYEDKLLALGFTFSEMRDESAKFLERNRILGLADISDKKKLAEANNSYMLQLDKLARVTGKSRDEIAKQLDQQMKNVRFQATQRLVAKEVGAEQAQVLQDVSTMLGSVDPAFEKGFQDAISGAINTPEAQAFWLAIGEDGKRAVQGLRSGAIKDANEALKIIGKSTKQMADQYGDRTLGQIGKTGSALETVIPGMMRFAQMTDEQYKNMSAVNTEQKDAGAAQDDDTKRAIAAQKKLQEMGQKLDDITRKEILPHAAASIEAFTGSIEDFVDIASKALGTKRGGSSGGVDQDGAFTDLGANSKAVSDVMSARTAQKKQIYGSEEFKQWRAAKGGGGLLSSGMEDTTFGVSAYMKEAGIPEVQMPEATGGSATGSTQQILDTIKKRESGGNYQAYWKGTGSTASGAYAFLDSSWQGLAKKYGIGTEFARAMDAPPEVQDALAAKYIEEILQKAGGDVSKVPLAWYTGNIQGKMSDKALAVNNGLTPEKYQEKWMADFNKITSKTAALGGVFSGPRSGYSATLHGNEAVVPLPNGNKIPVDMAGMTDSIDEQLSLMEEQTAGLEELLRTLKQGADISQRLLRASQV